VAARTTGSAVVAHAAVHGYATAFWWAAAIFVAGALICGALLTGRVPVAIDEAVPVAA
jgi:hypothetical protein